MDYYKWGYSFVVKRSEICFNSAFGSVVCKDMIVYRKINCGSSSSIICSAVLYIFG